MKRYVNGVEVELAESDAVVLRHGDRLIVKSNGKAETALAIRQGDDVLISYRGQVYEVEKMVRSSKRGGTGSGDMRAPMPGLIVDVLVEPGAKVQKGDKLLVLEAMKTQQAFLAPFDGVVRQVGVSKGDQVVDGQMLVTVEVIEA